MGAFTDVEFLWALGYVSLFFLALAVAGKGVDHIEDRRAKKAERRLRLVKKAS